MLEEEKSYKYDAFISYSWKDRRFGRKLEAELERYRVPKSLELPKRRLNIFRDVQDQIGNDLSESIKSGIRCSKFLIVICSPNSRDSEWVGKEIDEFAEQMGKQRIIPVILSGRPNKEVNLNDEQQDKAFHDSLNNLLNDPIGPDFRTKENEPFQQRLENRREAKFQLLATLFETEKETLLRRQRRRFIKFFIAAVVIALLLAVTFAWLAYKENQSAKDAQKEAESSKKVTDFLIGLFKLSDPAVSRGDTVTARGILKIGAERVLTEFIDQPEIQVRLLTLSVEYIIILVFIQMPSRCIKKPLISEKYLWAKLILIMPQH